MTLSLEHEYSYRLGQMIGALRSILQCSYTPEATKLYILQTLAEEDKREQEVLDDLKSRETATFSARNFATVCKEGE